MSDPETLAVYAAQARRYAAYNQAVNESDPRLAAFIAALPAAGDVLDLGCGPGHSARVMAAAGLNVLAVDAVAEMITLAAQHPGVTAQQQTFDDIKGSDFYDGIWANFSLLHAPRSDLPRILKSLHTALRAGGRFHIAMKLGTDTKRDTIGRAYTYVTQDELYNLLSTAGFNITKTTTGRDKGLDGTYADWIAVAAYG
ncbi:2-polyprenyl-3-methyl-5-hydroxy-6-metoxy-1,4-benzoquinol methylase [Sulfitobacter undariae]|uniref:2-polyprenyl-3-methyl-5-hydroxy-6-metoxy-1, 4-benzoquinol methylase n=1 Tax=Sulfitobacter undariae TaxID=1563671 RepID=A0A7W6GZI9_9RHOB|nr:class I SAM-dependent methyltransferase [Sulfitobacter undariae]MBB3992643.1 2-polyprenyl-3-methyl-5-hydroxy-6-metoxy-1,4-benzoquinol methylase [Sulfitobacter undariae]